MAFVITREDESLPEQPIVVVVYGDPGVGKTSFAFTAEKPLLMDFDKGAQRSIGRKTIVGFDTWQDCEDFVIGGHLDDFAPKTIILDTGGTMLDDFIGGHVMKSDSKNKQKSGSISLQGYGAMKDVFNNFVMKELKQRGIDLVIICHSTESEDEGRKVLRPKMTGGSKDILIAKADLLGYVYIDNNKRVINFNPTDRHIGKNCAMFPPIIIKEKGVEDGAETQLEEIIKQTKEHMSRMSDSQKEALEFIKEFKVKVSNCLNLEEHELLSDAINDLSDTYKVQVNKLLEDRFIELWKEEHIVNCVTLEDFNALIGKFADVPKRFVKTIQFMSIEFAREKGFKVGKEKTFEPINEVNEEAKTQEQKEEAKESTSKTQKS